MARVGGSISARLALGFVLVMVASVLLFSLISLQIVKLVKITGLRGTDRALGAFFGLARGVLVAVLLVLLAGLTPLPKERYWRDAFFRYPAGGFTTPQVEMIVSITNAAG